MHSTSRQADVPGNDQIPLRSAAEPPATAQEVPVLKAVLWDMDGTLVDTEPYWIASEQELVKEHGGSWSDEQALTLVGQSLWFSAGVLQAAGVGLDRRAIIDELTARVIVLIRQLLPWRPGARELLADLRAKGVRCALVTMSEGPLVREILSALPERSFEFTVTGDQVEHGKPHPEPYLRAVAILQQTDPALTLEQCIALEDSVPGVESALAAGLTTVGIPHAVALPEHAERITWSTLVGRSTADLRALKAQVG